MRIIKAASNFAVRVTAAGVMSVVLAVVPAAGAVAHPHKAPVAHPKVSFGILNAKGGTAAFTVDPAVSAGISALGITLVPTAPATAVGDVWSFPVQQGRILWMTRTPVTGPAVTRLMGGRLVLNGGLTATKGTVTVTFRNLVADLNEGRNGKVEVRVNGRRHHVNAFIVTAPSVNVAGRTASATLNLSTMAANLLNKALHTTSFKAGLKVGTVAVTVPAPV